MVPIAVLESRQSRRVSVDFYSGEIKTFASEAKIDAYIVSTEEGFSPLGSNLRFLASDIDVSAKEIKRLADWNRFQNPRVSLVAIQSRKIGGLLRGVILAACESSDHPEEAIARVALRVKQGGHDIAEAVIRRRFDSGLNNFEQLYSHQVDAWALYDNSGERPLLLRWKDKHEQ